MTILHYTLGLAPQRSGGLVRYAIDLMVEQSKLHRVAMLYPSGYNPLSRKITFKRSADFKCIECYKLHNSYPVPLLYGVKSPMDFCSGLVMSSGQMELFYLAIKPDVFHVHTLMGLPLELLEFLKTKGVKLLFTSHDYFGLCPRVNFIDSENRLCDTTSQERCARCNSAAPSSSWLRVRNSERLLKRYKQLCAIMRGF